MEINQRLAQPGSVVGLEPTGRRFKSFISDQNKRVCKYCNKEFDIIEFSIACVIQGKIYRCWRCKCCKQKLQKERRHKITDFFNEYKKHLKCANCGETDYRVLDFHHNDKKLKDIEVSIIIYLGWSIKRIMEEIEKCTILCCKCHRIFHWEEKFNKI